MKPIYTYFMIVMIALALVAKFRAISIKKQNVELGNFPIHFVPDNKQGKFLHRFFRLAKEIETEYNIPFQVSIAQSGLESFWGESPLAKKYNNYFGVKCRKHRGRHAPTNCCVNVPDDSVKDRFRRFEYPYEGWRAYAQVLQNERYCKAFQADTPEQFIREVHKAYYASDPRYSEKVIKIINEYKL